MLAHSARLADTGQTIPWILIGIAAVLVIGGIIIAVIRSRKKRAEGAVDEGAAADAADSTDVFGAAATGAATEASTTAEAAEPADPSDTPDAPEDSQP